MNPTDWTNAIKAQVLSLIVVLFGLAGTLGVDVPEGAEDQVLLLIGALFSIFVLFTYRKSPKRIPDGSFVGPVMGVADYANHYDSKLKEEAGPPLVQKPARTTTARAKPRADTNKPV